MDCLFSSDAILFRGSQEASYKQNSTVTWFGAEDLARKHGAYVHKFKTTRQLKLLDVASPVFQADFLAKVNLLFSEDNDGSGGIYSPVKDMILTPLGLPDFATQMYAIRRDPIMVIPSNMYHPPQPGTEEALKYNNLTRQQGYFGNRHRYSHVVPLENGDAVRWDYVMAEYMAKMYPGYDGYICRNPWPSYHMGGFLAPEICLFDCKICTEYAGIVMSSASGGGAVQDKGYILQQDMIPTKDRDVIYANTMRMAHNLAPSIFPLRGGSKTAKKTSGKTTRKTYPK